MSRTIDEAAWKHREPLARKLRLARVAAKLNLHEAAEILMMHPRLLSDIEFGRAECSREQADLMLTVYAPYEERG